MKGWLYIEEEALGSQARGCFGYQCRQFESVGYCSLQFSTVPDDPSPFSRGWVYGGNIAPESVTMLHNYSSTINGEEVELYAFKVVLVHTSVDSSFRHESRYGLNANGPSSYKLIPYTLYLLPYILYLMPYALSLIPHPPSRNYTLSLVFGSETEGEALMWVNEISKHVLFFHLIKSLLKAANASQTPDRVLFNTNTVANSAYNSNIDTVAILKSEKATMIDTTIDQHLIHCYPYIFEMLVTALNVPIKFNDNLPQVYVVYHYRLYTVYI